MNDVSDSSERPARLLVIAAAAHNPGGVFGAVEVRGAGDADQAARADCIRADAAGAEAAIGLGRKWGVPVVLLADADPQFLKEASCVLAASESAAANCIEAGADPARVVTMPPAVDRSLFTPEGEAAAGPQGRPRLLSLEHDNLDRALQASALATARLPDLRLVQIGGDKPLPAFAERREGLHENELPAWFRWADALLLPARSDGPVDALARALACGTPCITSNRPPMSEVVTDQWDGLLVDPESADEIAQAIRGVADPAVQARLAAPARTSSESFDSTAVQAREAALYRWLLGRQRPMISVVLPTYNRARLVEAAVRNVLSQDYSNLELIVVNDGSTDATAEILRKLSTDLNGSRLRVVSRENGGLPTALNTGFAAATGDYWTWTSDDNAYRPGALSALARELMLDATIGLVYADMLIRDEAGVQRRFVAGPPERLEEGSCVGGCFLYRAELARQVGKYDPGYTLAEDYDYWLRMHRIARFAWLHRVLYDYADAPHSLTRRRFREMQAVQMKLFEREQGGRVDWRQRKFEHLLRHASAAKNHGLPGAAMSAAWAAIRQQPSVARGWWALLRALTPMPLLNLSRRMRGLDAG